MVYDGLKKIACSRNIQVNDWDCEFTITYKPGSRILNEDLLPTFLAKHVSEIEDNNYFGMLERLFTIFLAELRPSMLKLRVKLQIKPEVVYQNEFHYQERKRKATKVDAAE